jgi:hypothetical protein
MKYSLCEWEENGYDDSDFYAAYYDDETGEVKSKLVGSTRYYGGFSEDGKTNPFEYPTPEVVEKARKVLEEHIFARLREAEDRAVLTPERASKGDRLRTTTAGIFKDKKKGTETPYEEGEVGTVIWAGHFGTFYRNGYNRRGRSNGRVGLRFDDGRVIFVALSKTRLDVDPASDEDLRERAERLSHGHQYGKMLSAKHAWDTRNFASAVAKEVKGA